MSCTSRGHMGGLLCSALNFLFLYWAGVVPFVPIYNITALIKMVGGWVGWSGSGSGFGLGACLGGRNSRLKILLLVFCTFADARAGLQCDGWEEDDDRSVFMDGVHGAVMKTTT